MRFVFHPKEEVKKLRAFCIKARDYGLRQEKFTPIRNWFMVELGLNAGLKVEEMSSLKCDNLFINKDRSSITVTGKGNKKRAIWINSDFKETYLLYLSYKRDFGYGTNAEDYLLNNLKGEKITKRALQKFFKAILKKSKSSTALLHSLAATYLHNFSIDGKQQQLQICTAAVGPFLNQDYPDICKRD